MSKIIKQYSSADITSVSTLKEFVFQYKYKPYFFYKLDNIHLSEFFLRELVMRKDTKFMISFDKNKIDAFATIGYLPWDSRIFDLKVGRIYNLIIKQKNPKPFLERICQYFQAHNYDYIDIKINSMEVNLSWFLEDIGFHFMNTNVTYSLDMDKINDNCTMPKGVLFTKIKKDDISILSNLASEAFIAKGENLNRFYLDYNLSKDRVGKLYSNWFSNCVSGKEADKIFVAKIDDMPVGFIACKVHRLDDLSLTIGDVPLNAVSKEFRGKGIYKALVSKALKWFKGEGCKYVEIKTQLTTLGPQYVWQHFGGRLVNFVYNFHKWFR